MSFDSSYQSCLNPLMGTLKPQSSGPLYSNTVIGTWPLMGGLLHLYSEEEPGWAVAPPRPFLAVQIAHPSTANVPITVSLYQLHIIRCGTLIILLHSKGSTSVFNRFSRLVVSRSVVKFMVFRHKPDKLSCLGNTAVVTLASKHALTPEHSCCAPALASTWQVGHI